MQCQHAHELFSDYITQDIDRALNVSFENHLASCHACQQEVASLRNTWVALDTLSIEEPPAFFRENLLSRYDEMQNEAEAEANRKWGFLNIAEWFKPRATLAYAASALIIILLGAEMVQSQRAMIGPFSWVSQMFRATPKTNTNSLPFLQVSKAEWQPTTESDAKGNLKVTLRPVSMPDYKGEVYYRLNIAGSKEAPKTGALNQEADTVVEIPMEATPASDAITVTLGSTPDVVDNKTNTHTISLSAHSE